MCAYIYEPCVATVGARLLESQCNWFLFPILHFLPAQTFQLGDRRRRFAVLSNLSKVTPGLFGVEIVGRRRGGDRLQTRAAGLTNWLLQVRDVSLVYSGGKKTARERTVRVLREGELRTRYNGAPLSTQRSARLDNANETVATYFDDFRLCHGQSVPPPPPSLDSCYM